MMPHYDNEDIQTPLFGEPQTRHRVTNVIIGVAAVLLVIATFVAACFLKWPPSILNILFGISILLVCIGDIILIYWYRQGDLEPKFRVLIYYNAFTLILLCLCANIYIYGEE